MSDREDRELVAEYLARREERAFLALYRRHTPALWGLALRLARGRTDAAEEIVQLAWIRAARRMETFRWESSLKTWLSGIALNCYREWLRGDGRRVADGVDLDEIRSAAPVHAAISRIDLERAISRLPDGYREVLILHDIQGFTHAEIGSLMGIRNGTSKSQLSRARRAVRSWIGEPREDIDERRAV